jgi:hypothetical protein
MPCCDPESAIISLQCTPDYDAFVSTLLGKLRSRILNEFCLSHVLRDVVNPETDGSKKLWLEFGVYQGSTARFISDTLHAHDTKGVKNLPQFYAFDSFKGLPEAWNKGDKNQSGEGLYTFSQGSFKAEKPPFDSPYVGWVKGWFNESLPVFLESDPSAKVGCDRNVSFAHLDADLYSSTSDVLKALEGRLDPGCTLVFDDLINFPDFKNGEMKALYELMQRTGRDIEVVGATGAKVLDNPSYEKRVPYSILTA